MVDLSCKRAFKVGRVFYKSMAITRLTWCFSGVIYIIKLTRFFDFAHNDGEKGRAE